ncbi:MAG: sigma-70 family RNA polymerase sigma factor [Methylococcaceae bacterium]
MSELNQHQYFEQAMLPHLQAAFNLALWLLHNHADAEDAIQEAYLRAFRHFDSFRGGDARVWLLAIVRNVCYTHLQSKKVRVMEEFNEELHGADCHSNPMQAYHHGDPALASLQNADKQSINLAIAQLPTDFREVIVLRELEELSYKEIAKIIGVPIGTVMSRLARARGLLKDALTKEFAPGSS